MPTATVAGFLAEVLGDDVPVRFRAYDGSTLGPTDAASVIVIVSPDALRRIVTAPGELGFARAYVAGDLEIEGDVFSVLEMLSRIRHVSIRPSTVATVSRVLGAQALRPLPPPAAEARLHGVRHSRARDAAAIAYHYDVPSDFFRIVLGPSMTYSCAVWTDDTPSLEQAQSQKHELVCRKLGLAPGMRLLDVGCGWASLVIHAALHHGVEAVGVTLSQTQAELARCRVADAGVADHVEIRAVDYRDVHDGPYDAVSSIGMFEHVGLARLAEYFERCHALVAPRGRFLNHGISRPGHMPPPNRLRALWQPLRRDFVERYVFPDGELHEIGAVVSAVQSAGFEVRHVESLREHYARTLRCWVANLEAQWDAAVAEAGLDRARVWRLYMAAAALGFEADTHQVHQVLATKTVAGASGLPLRPEVALP